MIYITGDCHGNYKKLSNKNFPEARELTKNDYVIVCGDFGYWCDDKEQRYWFNWLNERPFTTLFVDGNHENFDELNKLEVSTWNGGKVHKITDSIIHLMRGQVFNIEGKTFFTFGGAQTHDIADGILDPEDADFKTKKRQLNKANAQFRINHISWWEDELPTDKELDEGLLNLSRVNWKVDYIITHCASNTIQNQLNTDKAENRLTNYFDIIRNTCIYDKWLFGHYHKDEKVTLRDKCLYHSIIKLN